MVFPPIFVCSRVKIEAYVNQRLELNAEIINLNRRIQPATLTAVELFQQNNDNSSKNRKNSNNSNNSNNNKDRDLFGFAQH